MFRGQTKEYTLSRPTIIKELLYGSEGNTVREPSLVASAVRANFDADELLSILHIEVQNLIYRGMSLDKHARMFARGIATSLALPPSYQGSLQRDEVFNAHSGFDSRYGSGGWMRELVALAQHYGIPTYGMDLTENLDAAVWFATHKLVRNGKGLFTYRPVEWLGDSAQKWPCVYFFGLLKWQREHFSILRQLRTEAVRPKRQGAFLSLGGWGWHRNIAAEDLMTIAYLSPNFKVGQSFETQWLFPGPEEDPFYGLLLDRKHSVEGSGNLFEHFYKWALEFTA